MHKREVAGRQLCNQSGGGRRNGRSGSHSSDGKDEKWRKT